MVELVFIDSNDQRYQVEGEVGRSLMEVAMDNMVPHILADCGGCISCGTCRVDVVETWQSVVGQATASEADLIEGLDQPTPASRLACQVTVTEEMQGAEFLLSDEFC